MHQWKGLHEYYTMETQKFDFFFSKKFEIWLLTKSWNHLSFVNKWNWCINGKVFTSTTEWKPKNLNSSNFESWFLTKSWNHLSFVNISPTLILDTSMEWSSRVLQHGNPKMWKFSKKFEIDKIEFCPYPEFL